MQTRKMQIRVNYCFLLLLFWLLLPLISSHKTSIKNINSSYDNDDDEEVRRSMFSTDFVFGVSTSAYQIEGAYVEDGKSLTNWDVYSRIPGKILNGDNGYVADDHYHRFMEDIENIKYLGVNAYRFSISWARILPRGRFGTVNHLGVMFYDKIIDNLVSRGIEPYVTLTHSDFPYELEERYGSWLSNQIQEDFVLYAKTCFENFGDRVKQWCTVNEPNLFSDMAYIRGFYPPGHCSPPFGNCSTGNSDVEPLIATHNMLVSHAKAVDLYRRQFQPKQGGSIGIIVHGFNYEPYRDDEVSHQAVKRAFDFNVAWALDPVIYGDYPSLMRKYLGKKLPKFSIEEAKLIKGSVDYIGINHYGSLYAVDCLHYPSDCTPSDNRPIRGFAGTTGFRDGILIGDEMGAVRFYVVPQGMEKIIDTISYRYPHLPIYVTENGYAPPHQQDMEEMIQDIKRIKYHKSYLAYLAKAIREGANVKGYFAWTLMDNFEWVSGYNVTFGLYYVDRATLQRIPKLSARWYSHFLANNQPEQNVPFISIH